MTPPYCNTPRKNKTSHSITHEIKRNMTHGINKAQPPPPPLGRRLWKNMSSRTFFPQTQRFARRLHSPRRGKAKSGSKAIRGGLLSLSLLVAGYHTRYANAFATVRHPTTATHHVISAGALRLSLATLLFSSRLSKLPRGSASVCFFCEFYIFSSPCT